jgi:hypothetical protein
MRATCLRTQRHPVNEKSFKIGLNLQKKRPNSPTQLGEDPQFDFNANPALSGICGPDFVCLRVSKATARKFSREIDSNKYDALSTAPSRALKVADKHPFNMSEPYRPSQYSHYCPGYKIQSPQGHDEVIPDLSLKRDGPQRSGDDPGRDRRQDRSRQARGDGALEGACVGSRALEGAGRAHQASPPLSAAANTTSSTD